MHFENLRIGITPDPSSRTGNAFYITPDPSLRTGDAFYVIIYMCQWDNLVYIEWENQQHGKGFHILNILLPEHKIRNEIVHNGMKLQPN